VIAVGGVVVGGSLPLLLNPRYYFINDTEAGALGQWWKIGDRLLSGDWSLLNTDVWQSGNYQAEGAWGIFSPFLWLVGLGSHLFSDGAVYATIVKLLCLTIAAGGLYVAARTFNIPPPWAAAIAVSAPLAGFTFYFDAPSWVNGLMAWSFWPWMLAFTRRTVLDGRSPFPSAAASLLLIGIGYPSATLFTAFTFVAVLVEAIVRRIHGGVWRGLGAASVAGLFTLIVHVPGLLTSPVSGRQSRGITNDGFLTADLNDLLIGVVPTGGPFMNTYGGDFPNAPITYFAWFLPAIAFLDLRRFGRVLRSNPSLVILLTGAVLGALAPAQVGPLRFPIRVLPFVAALVIMVVVLGLARARVQRLSRRHLVRAVLLAVASAVLMLLGNPAAVRRVTVAMVFIVALIALLWYVFRSRRLVPSGLARGSGALASGVVILGCLLVVVPQHMLTPSSPLGSWRLPSDLSAYDSQLEEAEDDVLVVGDPTARAYDDVILGNGWYITGRAVQNAYSSVYYPGYSSPLCMNYIGATCGDLYERLFEPLSGSSTGERLVDLISVNTIVAVKRAGARDAASAVPRSAIDPVPEGWRVVRDTAFTRMMVRDNAVHGAGGVVWSSDGTVVELMSEDPMATSFRVDAVPNEGGTVALALIAWPGYEVEGGELLDTPVDGLNLGVRVDASAEGSIVTVRYWSPGWQVQVVAGVLLVLILAVWSVLRWRPMKRYGAAASAAPASAAADE